ncbi:MAG: HGGxSTG domain-containing protein [Aliidongia sp.]
MGRGRGVGAKSEIGDQPHAPAARIGFSVNSRSPEKPRRLAGSTRIGVVSMLTKPKVGFSGCAECGARTRLGAPCRSPAMRNGRCRMHGGKSPGAPRGERNGNFSTGAWTKEAIAERRSSAALLRQCREVLAQFKAAG